MPLKILIFIVSLGLSSAAWGEDNFILAYAPVKACFTPGQDCAQDVIDEIDKAKHSVYVQAYSFTSAPIAKALVDAKARGVDIKVILDKGQVKNKRYTIATYLNHAGIPVYVDYKVAIAHNKVIIIDQTTLITGSFNFTTAAQKRNAENLLIITNLWLAESYLSNWEKRKNESKKLQEY